MNPSETGATGPQIIVSVGVLVLALAAIIGGALLARRQLARRKPGDTVRAQGIALIIGGLGLAALGLNLFLLSQSGFSTNNIFGRWFFLPPLEFGNWFDGFIGNPGLNLLIIAVFIGWLNLPSLTQLRSAGTAFADPARRSGAIWTVVVLAALVAGGLGGSIVGGLINRALVIPGAIVGGLLLVVVVVVVASVIINLRNKGKSVAGND